jgi:hypothetical protein
MKRRDSPFETPKEQVLIHDTSGDMFSRDNEDGEDIASEEDKNQESK